ncbi:MAG: methyltransferase domain-containing protein [Burkholderiaceae bacterium]|jgi:malonyl-CoA O-methyltransferase|nr:methyltransferase domain-containing protein [Burkholderiaceae bacterium]
MLKPSDLDPKALRLQATRRARNALERDFIAREVEQRMAERLDLIRHVPTVIADIGCGRAAGQPALSARYPQAIYLGVDLSAAALRHARHASAPASMLARAGRWLSQAGGALAGRRGATPASGGAPMFVAADTHRLPLRNSSVDLIWSNLAWHGFVDPLAVVAEWQRIVRPDGLLMFSAFGVDSLRDLLGPQAGLVSFPDMHDMGDALVHAGFAEPVMDAERMNLGYRRAEDLVAELRAALGGNALAGRRRSLLGRAAYRRWLDALEARRGADGLIPVVLEIIQGHAWCPSRKRLPEGLSPITFTRRAVRPGDAAILPPTD